MNSTLKRSLLVGATGLSGSPSITELSTSLKYGLDNNKPQSMNLSGGWTYRLDAKVNNQSFSDGGSVF